MYLSQMAKTTEYNIQWPYWLLAIEKYTEEFAIGFATGFRMSWGSLVRGMTFRTTSLLLLLAFPFILYVTTKIQFSSSPYWRWNIFLDNHVHQMPKTEEIVRGAAYIVQFLQDLGTTWRVWLTSMHIRSSPNASFRHPLVPFLSDSATKQFMIDKSYETINSRTEFVINHKKKLSIKNKRILSGATETIVAELGPIKRDAPSDGHMVSSLRRRRPMIYNVPDFSDNVRALTKQIFEPSNFLNNAFENVARNLSLWKRPYIAVHVCLGLGVAKTANSIGDSRESSKL